MIHRKNSTKAAISASVGIDSNAASSSNNNVTNNVYVQTPYPHDVKVQPSTFIERDIELQDINEPNDRRDVRSLILETYANILLNQDVALIANLVSKHTIIIPLEVDHPGMEHEAKKKSMVQKATLPKSIPSDLTMPRQP